MCGIAGFWGSYPGMDKPAEKKIAQNMASVLVHRGPDGDGVWQEEQSSIALSHRRLSIQDLSEAGAQPMESSSRRYVIVYNGEIYNFLELKEQLEQLNIRFRGHSDTEVLLEAIQVWGLREALKKCNGMFAFALWDKKDKTLTLAKDRVGKKPLYYGLHSGVLIFGSELKAICQHPAFKKEINHAALAQLIKYSWVSSPDCIFKNTKKLPAGCYLVLSSNLDCMNQPPVQFWSAANTLNNASLNPFSGSIQDAEDELESLLIDATRKRIIADVEVGALLSGGIDSSIVTAIMQKVSSAPVRTFSIGYHEQEFNEANYARDVANHLGTKHEEYYVTPKDSLDVIQDLPDFYDEPFADASQIPTYLLSRLVRNSVKVALTGDGGDETFAGYTRYTRCRDQWSSYRAIPGFAKSTLGRVAEYYANIKWKKVKYLANGMCETRKIGKYQKIGRRITALKPEELYCRMNLRYAPYEDAILDYQDQNNVFVDTDAIHDCVTPLKKFLYIDYVNYLTDDVLTKVDRASMAVSLETRSPILDYRILEFAWGLPDNYLVEGINKKRILKNLLYKYVPQTIVDRPKMGFGIPVGEWVKKELYEWANDMLTSTYIKKQGIFNSGFIEKYWQQHLKGCAKHDTLIWSLLMFQIWHQKNFG